jgi:hypothetical protein
MLRLVYRKDVAMECRYADDMIALANATKLVLTPHVGKEFLPDADAGAWSLQLPPATVELQVLPFWYALEDLHIGECTLAASMSVTSDTMPCLKHLRFTDVSVRTDDTKAAITVLADDLRTLRMSCRWYSKTESPSEPLLFLCHSGVTAVFTKYSLAPFGCADKAAEKHCWLICCERKILFRLGVEAWTSVRIVLLQFFP